MESRMYQLENELIILRNKFMELNTEFQPIKESFYTVNDESDYYPIEDSTTETLQVKYFDEDPLLERMNRLEKIPEGDWIDLSVRGHHTLKAGEYYLLPLGVAIVLPEGYEARIIPRSSTFKRWKVLQATSGLIDNTYRKEWRYGVYVTEDIVIPHNTKICQFRIQTNMPELNFVEINEIEETGRGGFGSTDEHVYKKSVTES